MIWRLSDLEDSQMETTAAVQSYLALGYIMKCRYIATSMRFEKKDINDCDDAVNGYNDKNGWDSLFDNCLTLCDGSLISQTPGVLVLHKFHYGCSYLPPWTSLVHNLSLGLAQPG